MKQFFPMGRGEIAVLPFLIIFAIISFLPIWRTIEIGGMAVFGWLMAILMLVSPVLTSLVIQRSDKTVIKRSSSDKTDTPKVSDSDIVERKQNKKD
jgi:hypothetical protein